METRIKLLLVDDEPDFVNGLARLISSEFPEMVISTALGGNEALAALSQESFQLVISDLRMPGMDGLTLTKSIARSHPDTKVIILTGFGTIEKAVEAVKTGSFDFLTKPVSSDQLYSTLEKAIGFIQLENENYRLRQLLDSHITDDLLGESAAMHQVKQSIQAVAVSDYPVLICGESGTGKELAARQVHRLSNRSGKPFLAVNCPAIPDTLLESELFGYRKGAFTGADKDKDGLFRTADKGTLHLDEIGDISQAMQQKLLRFLQEGEIRPVGSTKTLQADVRVIASTNRSLEQKVEENSFRADLYYRLNVVTIRMPSLSERVEDIPLLARCFLDRTLQEMKMDKTTIDPNVLTYLSTREWPGNVRELQNFMRRLVVFSSNGEIVPETVHKAESSAADSRIVQEELGTYKTMKSAVADRFSKSYFEQLFKETGGNISEAARISGLSRVAIQKLCKRLNIEASKYRSP